MHCLLLLLFHFCEIANTCTMVLQHQNFQHIQLKYLIYKKLQLFKMSNLITLFVLIRIWSICLKTLVAKSTCHFSLVQLTKMDFLTM
jgi:hypothetical protein